MNQHCPNKQNKRSSGPIFLKEQFTQIWQFRKRLLVCATEYDFWI